VDSSKIPHPGPIPQEASDLTLQEIADLSPTKRSTVQYERQIREYQSQIDFLRTMTSRLAEENAHLVQAQRASFDCRAQLLAVKRSKLDLYLNFGVGTCLVAIGGGLVGSHPMLFLGIPWLNILGWSFIVAGIITGLVPGLLANLVLVKFPKAANDWMK
jgi:hypothetical protein